MNAITRDILNIKVENINYALGLTSNKYFIQKAYGGYRLCKTTNEAGGCADITERMTKKELASVLDGIYNTIRASGLMATEK